MFYHKTIGLITSHSKEQFEVLSRGEGYCCVTPEDCYAIIGWLELGKRPDMFAKCRVSNEMANVVLEAYHTGLI